MIESLFKSFKNRFLVIWRTLFVPKSVSRNFLFMFSAKSIGLILGVLVTPIMSRIYAPESYGLFTVYNSIVLNFVAISTLSYAEAMNVSKRPKDFYSLFWLCLFLWIVMVAVLVIALPIILELFDSAKGFSQEFKMLVILGALVFGFNGIISRWNIFLNNFEFASVENAVNVFITRAANILIGLYFNYKNLGLIFTEIGGKSLTQVVYFKTYIWTNRISIIAFFSLKRVIYTFKKYASYPMYILPGKYLEIIVNQIPIVVISRYYGMEILGQFSMALSLINLPLNLIGNSFSPILIPKLIDVKRKSLKTNLVEKAYFASLATFIVPIFVLIYYGPHIFIIVFGEKWEMAGRLSGVLSSLLIFELLKYVFASAFQVFNRERFILKYQLVKLLFVSCGAFIGGCMESSETVIIGLVFGKLIAEIYYIHSLLQLFSSSKKSIFLTVSIAVCLLILGAYILKN